jgi:hypothetical protein
MKKTLALATSIAVLAGIWTVVVFNIKTIGSIPFVLWPTFVAWAAFFYLGASGTGMRNGLVQLFTGAILSGFFVWIYGLLKVNDPAFIVLGIFVVIIAWPLTALSAYSKLWAAVPAGFCGAACWFGVSAGGADPLTTTIATLIPLLCGEVLGWLSMWIINVTMPEPKAAGKAAKAS